MFFDELLPYEILIMETFLKYKVRQIVSIIYKEYNRYIPRVETPYLIRYFYNFQVKAKLSMNFYQKLKNQRVAQTNQKN